MPRPFCPSPLLTLFLGCALAAGGRAAEPSSADADAYRRGYESFKRGDHPTAFGSLAALAPFEQDAIGPHARYLIARIHHLGGERPEAATNYAAAVEQFHHGRK